MHGLTRALTLTWRTSPLLTGLFVLLTVIGALAPVAALWLTKTLIDTVVNRQAQAATITRIGLAIAVTGLLTGLIPYGLQYAQKETERRVGLLAQDQLFAVVERFVGLARFESPQFLDRLRLALQYGGATPGVVVSTSLSIGRVSLTAIGFLGSLLILSVWMPFLVLASAVPVLGAQLWLARRRADMHGRLSPVERREVFYRELLTNVQAAKETRLFGIGAYLRGRMQAERRESNARQEAMDRREVAVQAATGLVSASFAGLALLWAMFAAVGGRVTAGEVSLLLASLGGVQSALGALMQDVGSAHKHLILFRSYLDIVDDEADLPVSEHPAQLRTLHTGIEFRDVWFRYGPDHPWALSGVNLTIAFGETVGLVGRNGAGKSTLIKLLCRMYDPDRGEILWDGVDLRSVDPAALRARISAVFQDFMKYDLTAAENIGLGDLSAGFERKKMEEAARRAGADGMVAALPRGYDTFLSRIFLAGDRLAGDRLAATMGVTLSGGQWQRLALARAYARGERDLLILDEPSAGLDAEAEYEIHSGLKDYRAGRTSLLISHRLGAVRDADTLIILEKGQVIERGSHDDLLARGGRYARMFTTQAAGYQAGLAGV